MKLSEFKFKLPEELIAKYLAAVRDESRLMVMPKKDGSIEHRVFKEILDVDIALPLPRLTYKEAMERYGSDKPDTRFAIQIQDISDIVKDSPFAVFNGAVAMGGSVRAVVAKGAAQKTAGVLRNKLGAAVPGHMDKER